MSQPYPLVYLNGDFLPLEQAHISPLDRGFLFGDGVYEVVPVYTGRPFRMAEHLRRLSSSMRAIHLETDLGESAFAELLSTLVARNDLSDAGLYLQVTRGAPAFRDHSFPERVRPTVYAHCFPLKPVNLDPDSAGIATVTRPDIRWGACNIKSIALLANVLARQESVREGAGETILVRDDTVTECSASNVFIVEAGTLVTPPNGPWILPGITRDVVLDLARENDIPWREESFSEARLRAADEVWVTSSTKEITPVLSIDAQNVGNGRAGPLWQRVSGLYQQTKRQH
jgi:D-alanine transaminase